MSAEPLAKLRAFLAQHEVVPDETISTGGELLGFKGTPTLLLVAPNRVVAQVWYGRRVTAVDEMAVLREVN